MADKNNNQPPPDAGGSTNAVPDVITPIRHGDDDVHRVIVTNEEMAEHLKVGIPGAAKNDSMETGTPPAVLEKPGEKFLPGLELDFGEEGQGDEPDDKTPAADAKKTKKVEGDKPAKVEDVGSKEPTMSSEDLSKLAKETIKSPEMLAQFNANLEAFENRAPGDGLTKQDKEEFYAQIGRTLEASKKGNRFYSSEELQTIASEMMRQGAKPGDVNQGVTSTCTTAALETVLYQQEPATIARLVSDVALTGSYTTADGSVVDVPEKNLHPNKYQKAETPADKARSLASHIAQPELINIFWNGQDKFGDQSGKKGKIRYEEGHPTAYMGDSHTRMMDYSKKPAQPFAESVGFSDPTQEDRGIYAEESRPIEGPAMHMEYLSSVYKQLRGNKGDLTIVSGKEGEGVTKPKDFDHFKAIMKDAQERKKPVLLGVHANRDPFLSDLNDSYNDKPLTEEKKKAQQSAHAHHALVATHTDFEGNKVTLQNQWGNKVDHTDEKGQKPKLPLDTVYDTIIDKPPEKTEGKTEREKTKPEEYIKRQKEFVAELEKDKDVVMFNERMKLHKYLSHWGHKDEAHEQAKILTSALTDRLKSDKTDNNIYLDTASFVHQMNRAGEKDFLKQTLDGMDARFAKTTPTMSPDYKKELDQVVKLHDYADDKPGAKKVVSNFAKEMINQYGKPESVSDKKSLGILSDTADILHNVGLDDEATKISQKILENIRAYEKAHGSDNLEVAYAKQTILFIGNDDTQVDLKKKVSGELQESYDRMKAKGDISSKTSTETRFTLKHYYESTKNPEALEKLMHDNIKNLEETPGRDGLKRGDKDFIGVYRYSAERLERAGGTKQAIPFMEKALDLAVKHGKQDDVERVANDLVHMLDSVGRTADADKVIKDAGVEVNFRRRKAASK